MTLLRALPRPLLLLAWPLGLAACPAAPPCGLGADAEVQAGLWFADEDEDGFGDPDAAVVACAAVGGQVDNSDDCDDAREDVFPGAPSDDCDGVDNDCDGEVDEDGLTAWHYDGDGDGAGGTISVFACDPPPDFVAAADDCDDDDPESHPGAVELCDDRDNDCDGTVGEPITARCYPDHDRDGHGEDSPGVARVLCGGTCAFADATAPDDCDDRDALTWRGAPESCDGKDNDCEAGSWVDEGADCGTGTSPTIEPSTGHVYLVVPRAVNWAGASNSCASRGYHLVWLDDGVEATFVQTLYANATDQAAMWVGLRWNACEEDGTFQRVDSRFDPWRCDPLSPWEAAALATEEDIDSIVLSGGALSAANGTGLFTGAVCEVEP